MFNKYLQTAVHSKNIYPSALPTYNSIIMHYKIITRNNNLHEIWCIYLKFYETFLFKMTGFKTNLQDARFAKVPNKNYE